MKSKLGKELKESLEEAIGVAKGERAPARAWKLTKKKDGTWTRTALDPEEIRRANARKKEAAATPPAEEVRETLGLTQSQFAALLGVSVNMLQNWEQGRRKPTGAARILLRVATTHPGVVLEAA